MPRAPKYCAILGCRELVHTRYCRTHEAQRRKREDSRKPSKREQGYDWQHRKLRAEWAERIRNGERPLCWRCGKPVTTTRFDLGHDDHRRHRGPEHTRCNRATKTHAKARTVSAR